MLLFCFIFYAAPLETSTLSSIARGIVNICITKNMKTTTKKANYTQTSYLIDVKMWRRKTKKSLKIGDIHYFPGSSMLITVPKILSEVVLKISIFF